MTNGLTPSQCPATTIDGLAIDPTCNTEGTGGIYSGPYNSFAHNVAANWQRVASPTLITELKFGFNRPYTAASRPNPDESCDLAAKLGFNNVNYPDDPITCGLPWLEMRPTSYAAIGDPTFIPMVTEDHNYQVAGSVTKMMGAHSIKMGGGAVLPDVRRATVHVAEKPVGLRRVGDQQRRGRRRRQHLRVVSAWAAGPDASAFTTPSIRGIATGSRPCTSRTIGAPRRG